MAATNRQLNRRWNGRWRRRDILEVRIMPVKIINEFKGHSGVMAALLTAGGRRGISNLGV
jgi:hypothetical protein